MNPEFPLYIPSKGRHESRLTIKTLESIDVPYFVIVESQQYDDYASVVSKKKILVLDKAYQRDYETLDDIGDEKSKGPGPARNFAWDHSMSTGYPWHWVMDDNIMGFWRLNQNMKIPVGDGTIFKCMEDFALRYKNVSMAGPNYYMFAPRKIKQAPFVLNTRIYSCNLIRNDLPYRWRGRYNEDTDLSLRMLKDGWCTIQFNAFLQQKITTQHMKGGNTAEFYEKEGTFPKSKMLVDTHPDVARMVWRYGRVHHHVDYRPFKSNRLVKRKGIEIPQGVQNYGMKLIQLDRQSHERPQAETDTPEVTGRQPRQAVAQDRRAAAVPRHARRSEASVKGRAQGVAARRAGAKRHGAADCG